MEKFQDVQQAHEILNDSALKTKYDTERAKLNRTSKDNDDPYGFRKPATRPPPPTAAKSKYPAPPPPRPKQQRPTFDPSGPRPNASAGADKFSQFGRPTASWDPTKFEQAARADAFHGFASMRSAQATPQPPPPRPPRPGALPNQGPNVKLDMPPPQAGPGLGFPGMSRTANARWSSYEPGTPGQEDPMARGPSAYAYTQGDYPQGSRSQPYHQAGPSPVSPTMPRSKPTSPLRHTRSQGYFNDPPTKPGFQRTSSRPYVAAGVGQRTDLKSDRLARSSSVRNSPTDRTWEEKDQSGSRPQSHHGPPPARHHSSSPPLRQGVYTQVPASSSSDEADLPTMRGDRPRAVPHKPRFQPDSDHTPNHHRHFSAEDNPALTGHFSNRNYTRVVDDTTNSTYRYPPPEPRDGPQRRPFPNMTTPMDDGLPRMNGQPGGGLYRSGTWAPKYVPSSPSQWKWSQDWKFTSPTRDSTACLNGLPSWAVPSSVLPGALPNKPRNPSQRLQPVPESSSERPDGSAAPTTLEKNPNADFITPCSSMNTHDAVAPPHGHYEHQNVSQGDPLGTFSAADWDGKFSGTEHFQPTETSSRDRRSPTRTNRTRARSTGTGSGTSRSQGLSEPTITTQEEPPEPNGIPSEQPDIYTAAAFQTGKFSAEDWAEKLKNQKWEIPNNELNVNRDRNKAPKRGSRSNAAKRLFPTSTSGTDDESDPTAGPSMTKERDPDAMEVDDDLPTIISDGNQQPAQATQGTPDTSKPVANGVDLSDLTKAAPFAPSNTGLKDLDDLHTSLPFQSRAADDLNLDRNESQNSTNSGIRRLNLPRAPKTVQAPLVDSLTQDHWESYVQEMYSYMHDWNVFNIKMIDHFRARQDQVNVGMIKHWISSVSDGPSADNIDLCSDTSLDQPRAGYAAYMQWLDDDDVCRAWWDEATERHRRCIEDLGKVRARVKRTGDEPRRG